MNKYITIGILLLIVALVIIYRNKLMELLPGAQAATPAPAGGATPQPEALNKNKVLQKGVSGPEVKQLQQWLGGLNVDGIFGPATEARLQERKGVMQTTLNIYLTLPDKTDAVFTGGAGGSWGDEDNEDSIIDTVAGMLFGEYQMDGGTGYGSAGMW